MVLCYIIQSCPLLLLPSPANLPRVHTYMLYVGVDAVINDIHF